MPLTTDAGWLEMQLETLFPQDARGRLQAAAARPDEPTPRFFFGATRVGNLWRFREDLPGALIQRLARLAGAEGPASELRRPPERLAAIREVLSEHAPIVFEWWGPAFRFPVNAASSFGDRTVPVVSVSSIDSPELLSEEFPELARGLEERRPCLAVLEDDRPVSVCFSARRGRRAAEAGVDTLSGFRRRGFATALTAAWADAIRREGLEPLYSTSWENRASLGLARKLGLEAYGTDRHFR